MTKWVDPEVAKRGPVVLPATEDEQLFLFELHREDGSTFTPDASDLEWMGVSSSTSTGCAAW